MIKLCHYACSQFTRRSKGVTLDFHTFFNVYLKLLLKLTAINHSQDKPKPQESVDTETLSNVDEPVSSDLTVNDVYTFLIKQCLDRETPLITIE